MLEKVHSTLNSANPSDIRVKLHPPFFEVFVLKRFSKYRSEDVSLVLNERDLCELSSK